MVAGVDRNLRRQYWSNTGPIYVEIVVDNDGGGVIAVGLAFSVGPDYLNDGGGGDDGDCGSGEDVYTKWSVFP